MGLAKWKEFQNFDGLLCNRDSPSVACTPWKWFASQWLWEGSDGFGVSGRGDLDGGGGDHGGGFQVGNGRGGGTDGGV